MTFYDVKQLFNRHKEVCCLLLNLFAVFDQVQAIDTIKLKDFDVRSDGRYILKCFTDGSVEISEKISDREFSIKKRYKSLTLQTSCRFFFNKPNLFVVASVTGFEVFDLAAGSIALNKSVPQSAHRFSIFHLSTDVVTIFKGTISRWQTNGKNIYSKRLTAGQLEDVVVSKNDAELGVLGNDEFYRLNGQNLDRIHLQSAENVTTEFPYLSACSVVGSYALGAANKLSFIENGKIIELVVDVPGEITSVNCFSNRIVFTTYSGNVMEFDLLTKKLRNLAKFDNCVFQARVTDSGVFYGTCAGNIYQQSDTGAKEVKIKSIK